MPDNHRFSDEEISLILERAAATEADVASRAPGTGLTLAELQEVAAQVGISPDRIAAAAREVASPDVSTARRTFMGVPISVTRTVHTERPLTDDEWLRLVAELRETFDAQGRVSAVGTLRSWTNGNLQVHEEPAADSYRIRMRTLKGDASALVILGAIFATLGGVLLMKSYPKDNLVGMVLAGIFIVGGLGRMAWTRVTLGRWARDRAAQMEALAARIPRLFGSP